MSVKANRIAGVLAVALLSAALILPGPAAYAGDRSRRITGRVVSVSRDANTIALDTGEGNSTVRAFDLTEGVSVRKGGERGSLDDIRAGDLVTITYHQDGDGLDVIDDIAIEVMPRQRQV